VTRIYSAQDDADYRAGIAGRRGAGRKRIAQDAAPAAAPTVDADYNEKRAARAAQQAANAAQLAVAYKLGAFTYAEAFSLIKSEIGTARTLALLAA
jgi:hypothetical protein